MTSFAIDTGASGDQEEFTPRIARVGAIDALAYDILQTLPDDATQAAIDGMIEQYVTGLLRAPKTLLTVRRKFVALWPLIAPLAVTSPETFDAILLEYAERTTC